MAKRGRRTRGTGGRIATVLLVVGALAALGYGLLGNERVRNLFGVDVERIFETYVTGALDGSPFSTEGIFRAVEAAGWSAVGERGVVRTEGGRGELQTFRREGVEVEVRVVELDSGKAASAFVDGVGDARRALQFDRRVAVIDPLERPRPSESGPVASLVAELRNFRRMVRHSDG